MKYGIFSVVALFLALALPLVAWADPLTGADADVGVFLHNSDGWGEGSFTDDTTDANDQDVDGDVAWMSAGGGGEEVYIGHLTSKFTQIYFDVSTAASMSMDQDFQYWNGSSWTSLTFTSSTHPFASVGTNAITFTAPSDWDTTSVNGTNAYYIRLQSADGNTMAALDQISLTLASSEVPEVTDVLYITTLIIAGWFVYRRFGVLQQQRA